MYSAMPRSNLKHHNTTITKFALYSAEMIFCTCDEFFAAEFLASCFLTSFPPSIFDQLFFFGELFSTSYPRFIRFNARWKYLSAFRH